MLRAATVVSCVLLIAATIEAANAPPNIVVLLCDDLGYGDLSCFAHPQMVTPNLDRLAGEGVKLTHCYSAAPVCSPSRAGMLTGRHPYRLGIRDWIPEKSGIFLRPTELTLAMLLKQGGYRTAHAGKWHLNSLTDGREPTPGDFGFEHWLMTQNNAAPSHLNPTNFVRDGKPVGPTRGASSHLLVDDAIEWLDNATDVDKKKPFYLNVWFHEPHEPVEAAEEFLSLYPHEENVDRRHYLGDVSQMDAAVGKLMKYLDEHGLRENTFVFFTSDNGPETLKRYKAGSRSYGSPGPLRGMKLHITEAGYRVPGIMRWPGRIQPGTASAEPVCNVDLLPTVCAMANIDSPKDRPLDGVNLLPMFTGKPLVRPHPLYWQYDIALSKPWVISLRDGEWKLLSNATLDKFELYRITEDIGEARNLAGEQPDRVRAMAEITRQLHSQINAEGLKSGNPPPKDASKP